MGLSLQHLMGLPTEPDSKAFNEFLIKRKAANPDHFADLSLAVIKLMGPGKYVLERPATLSKGTSAYPFRAIPTPRLPIDAL
jgi:hypothetical protein